VLVRSPNVAVCHVVVGIVWRDPVLAVVEVAVLVLRALVRAGGGPLMVLRSVRWVVLSLS